MQTQFRLFKANQNTLSQILFFSLVVRANNLGFRVCYYFQVWEETFQSSLLVCLNHILRRTSRVWRFFSPTHMDERKSPPDEMASDG
jgi:hypothetical protein